MFNSISAHQMSLGCKMEGVLDEIVSIEELQKFEKHYHEQLKTGNVSVKSQFEYAFCLVRSKYPADIKKGIMILTDLLQNGDDAAKRDYLFYLAVGNAKLREYTSALRYIRTLLSLEPENHQAKELEYVIKKRMEKEGLMGIGIVGGALVVLGGLIGLGIALIKK